MNFPKKVTITEVGPRDGFQFEKKIIPAELKIEIIESLSEAGIGRIQAASFVNPARVPQMADAEKIIAGVQKKEGLALTGLALNTRGVQRAGACGLEDIEVSISASDPHSRKNTGMSLEEALDQGKKMIRLAREFGMNVAASIQCAFGCVYESAIKPSHVLKMIKKLTEESTADKIILSDTTGMGNPQSVRKLLDMLLPETGVPVSLHLHDTRGLGLVNLMAAMECGVTEFDSSFGGMGGCPFVEGAAGNVATEDTVWLLESMGIETGIDINGVAKCSMLMEKFLGRRLPGKMHRIDKV